MGALQAIHHRTLDFGKVQTDTRLLEAQIDGFQALERAGVDVIYCRAHQNEMPETRVVCDQPIYGVFQEPGIHKRQAFVDPQCHHRFVLENVVTLHVAEMLGGRHLADNCPVWTARAVNQ